MNADDIDQMIRETQHRHADRIHGTGDPVGEVFSRVQRARRRRRTGTGVAVAVLAAAGIVVAVFAGTRFVSSAPPVPSTSLNTPSPTAASGAPQTLAEALRTQLAANPAVRTELLGSSRPTGTVLCATHVFGSDASHAKLYTWVSCGTYSTGPDARELSGGGDPAVLSVTGAGSGTRVVAVRFPRVAHLDQDLAAMFPAQILNQVQRRDFDTTPTGAQLLAEAQALDATPSPSAATTTAPARVPTPHRTGQGLVAARSGTPASGVCGLPGPKSVVTVFVETDKTSCYLVRGDQVLRILNDTASTGSGRILTVWWADFTPVTLAPGQSVTYPGQVGSYLALGVHDATTRSAGFSMSGEVWFR